MNQTTFVLLYSDGEKEKVVWFTRLVVSAFPSRIMIPIQKQIIYLQGFGITWQRVPSQNKNDLEATKVPYTYRNVFLANLLEALRSHS